MKRDTRSYNQKATEVNHTAAIMAKQVGDFLVESIMKEDQHNDNIF